MISLLLVPLAAAAPLGEVELVDGAPEFTSCFVEDRDTEGTCAWRFYHFLAASMGEQGFTFAHNPVHTAAWVRPDAGLRIGAQIDTFPFGPAPKNLSGKVENTQFSPVLPRLFAGLTVGERSRGAVGLSLLPPIPVGGASALIVGADGSLGWSREGWRFGAAVDATYAVAHAPITASQAQFDDRDSLSNPDNLDPDTYEAVCGTHEDGCIDRFRQISLGLRAGAASSDWVVNPYGALGLSFNASQLYVMYDDTTWAMKALQPTLHAGATWAPVEALLLSAGGDVAAHGGAQSEDGAAGVFWKLDGALSWRL